MSEYNKTILTNAGIDLARRANKGVATFQLTRGASSTDNLSGKTTEELQNLTQLPSVQQSVSLSDVAGTTDNPDTVIGIRMTFDNQNLSTGYNVHTVGVYAKEPGKDEILYGVATAKTPEYIPDFREQMLFKFDFLMYLVIGRTDKVTVQVSPDDVYLKKDTYNKAEIDAKVSDAVSKLNDKDAEILKNLNDYKQENKTYHQNLEQQLDTKADKSAVNQQLETKADKSTTYTKDEVDNIILPKADKSYVDGELSKKADKATTYTKDEVNSKIAGQVKSVNGHRADSNGEVTLPKLKAKTMTSYNVKNKSATFDENAGFDGNGNFSRWPVDQFVIGQLADAINAKLPIEEGPANTDLLMNAGNKIVYWHGNGDAVKNLPPMNNRKYFFAVKLFDTNWGSVTVVDQDGTYWLNTKNDVWTGWRSVVTNEHLKKLKFVKQSLNQNGDTFQDTKFVTQESDGTFKINIYDSDFTAQKVSWLLKNTNSYNISANTDLNDIKAPGLYHCSGTSNIVNAPSEDNWFNMVVNSDNWHGSQAFYSTNYNQLYIRTWNSNGFKQWHRVIIDDDYNNLSSSKADKANTYTKDEVDNRISPKADKSYVDGELSKRADKATTYTKDEVNNKIAGQVKSVNGHRADNNGEVTLPKLKVKTLIAYDVPNKRPTFDENATFGDNGYLLRWPVDQGVIGQLADAINALNLNLTTLRNELMNLEKRVDYNNPQGSFSDTTVNINDLRSTGIYRLANCYIQNGPYPTNNAHWIYIKVTVFDENTVYQTLYEGDNMYGRKSNSQTAWGKWFKYLNQEV